MKYFTLLVTLTCTLHCHLFAQNLVTNPGFEDYNACPPNLSGIDYSPNYTSFPTVKGWVRPLLKSTPDYYNTCTLGPVGLPNNSFGYKQPHTGNACAGIIVWQAPRAQGIQTDYREYIETKLSYPLQAGAQYCVSFFISPIISGAYYFNNVSVNRIGVRFSSSELSDGTDSKMTSSYSISNDLGHLASDTSDWIKIAAVYTAAGGEQWLTIGYFDTVATYVQIFPAVVDTSADFRQYLFVDDVNVFDIKQGDTTMSRKTINVCDLSKQQTLSELAGATYYRWSNNATTAQITVNDTGTYWCLAHYDACNTSIDTFHLVYVPFNKLDIGGDTVSCQDHPITLRPNHYYNSYQWGTGQVTDTLTPQRTGEYILTVTDACGTQKDSAYVTVRPPTPAPVVSDTTICEFVPGALISVAGTDLVWYGDVNDVNGLPSQPVLNTGDTGTTVYYITQTIGHCISPKAKVSVTIRYKPHYTPATVLEICNKDSVQLGRPLPDVQYAWTNGDTACCIPCHASGVYMLTVSNNCGTSTDTTTVVTQPCDLCIHLPNAFTPNGDGINDELKILVDCPITSFHLQIYDRWGQQVFVSDDPGSTWNGTVNGEYAERGVYVYSLEYVPKHAPQTRYVKGNVTIIR